MGAAVLFLIANAFPIVGLEAAGHHSSTTLFGAVRQLYDDDMTSVAGLVFTTTILMPGLEIAALLYLLLPLKLGRVPRGLPAVFRLVHAVRPWGMVEVFMLGTLVALVKLAALASVVPGIALWSFVVLDARARGSRRLVRAGGGVGAARAARGDRHDRRAGRALACHDCGLLAPPVGPAHGRVARAAAPQLHPRKPDSLDAHLGAPDRRVILLHPGQPAARDDVGSLFDPRPTPS